MANAAIHVMNLDKSVYIDKTKPQLSHINVGSGEECSIFDLAEMIAEVTDFKGNIEFDTSKPAGFPRLIMDITLAQELIDYNPTTTLREGLEETWNWFVNNQDEFKKKKNYFVEEKKRQWIF